LSGRLGAPIGPHPCIPGGLAGERSSKLTTNEGELIPYEAVFYRMPAYSVRKDEANADVP
jgi:hypothetical protein